MFVLLSWLYMGPFDLSLWLASAQVSVIAMDLPGSHWDVSPPVIAIGPDPGKALLSPAPCDGGLEVCLEEW